jgi:hypothetical protein
MLLERVSCYSDMTFTSYYLRIKKKKYISLRFITTSPLKTSGCAPAPPSLQTYGTTRPRTWRHSPHITRLHSNPKLRAREWQEGGYLGRVCLDTYLHTVGLSLFLSTSLLELHATHVHYSGSDLVDIVFLFLSKTQYVEGLLYEQKSALHLRDLLSS